MKNIKPLDLSLLPRLPQALMIHYIEETDSLYISDNQGYLLETGALIEIAKGLLKTATNESIVKEIYQANEEHYYNDREYWLKNAYEKKGFRKNLKRNWSFKCAECEENVSSKTDVYYFRATLTYKDWYGLTFCSENCAINKFNERFPKERIATPANKYVVEPPKHKTNEYKIVRKEFKKKVRKKPWIFYCDHCRTKVTSDTHDHYYQVLVDLKDGTLAGHTVCSESCAEAELPSLFGCGL